MPSVSRVVCTTITSIRLIQWDTQNNFIHFVCNFLQTGNLTIMTILTVFDHFGNIDQFWLIFTMLKILDKDQYKDIKKDNPRDLWHLRHWLQFCQLRTWNHDNLCDPTFKSDTGENSQFLQCFITSLAWNLSMAGSPKKWKNMATRIAWSKIRPMGKILEIILWIRNWTEKAFLKNVHCAIDDWLRHIFVAFVALTMYF